MLRPMWITPKWRNIDGDQPPRLAVQGQRREVAAELDHLLGRRTQRVGTGRELDPEHDEVRRDQHVGYPGGGQPS